MSVQTETQVPTEEGGLGHRNQDEDLPPPLIVEGEMDSNRTKEIQELEKRDEDEKVLPEEPGSVDTSPKDEKEPEEDFPLKKLKSLDEQLGRPKWVVPVRSKDELEMLLRAAIRLAKERRDHEFEECQRFYKEGLSTSFVRILTDDAVNTWKPDIQLDIYNNSRLFVELCVAKIPDDNIYLLDVLAILFNPSCKWNVFNSPEPSATYVEGVDETKLFAKPKESAKHSIKGRLVDLINLFGENGGFKMLYDRVCGENQELNVPSLAYLLRPFGHCCDFLTDALYEECIVPVVNKVIAFLDGLSDESLKKEAATDTRSETFSSIMKSLRHLCRRIPGREDIETFRLKMVLRLLQISSFSGKMNALNEINKIIPTSITYHPHFRTAADEEQLTVERIGEWIKSNNVLTIVFRDNLHQPQYVEKLDRLVRFCIKEKVLTLEDLDRIWACQDGKHEAIVKNIHDLLVKLAWDFSPEQLDYLFGCFQRSWVGSSKKQRDELLDFIRHLAEDDKEGIMASKVLELLWNLAHRDDCPPDTMEHALNAHIKILDYSCSQERESQKLQWLQRCVDEVTQGNWVIPALKQMREICLLYIECPVNYSSVHHPTTRFYYRNEIISHLDQNHHLLSHICTNVSHYMTQVRSMCTDDTTLDPEALCVDDMFNHFQQLQIRLDFVRFALKDGQLWLGHNQALMVWESLALAPVFPSDRDVCFKWFAKLAMWDEPDIEPETAKHLFTQNILNLTPSALTDNGFRCFDKFFRMVNLNQHGLSKWNRSCFITESVDLIGLDYLWDCILQVPDDIVHKPIELLKDIFTNLSSKLPQEQIHQEFIGVCVHRMELIFKGLMQYKPGEIETESVQVQAAYKIEVNKLVRCLKLMIEYVVECDEEYMEERAIPPHGKAHWGKPLSLTIRYIPAHSHQPEEFELWTHGNETIAALRRHITRRLNLSNSSKLELSVGNDIIRKTENHRFVMSASVPLRDKMVVTVRIQQFSNVSETSMQSSDNSTDSSEGSMGQYDGPNLETEKNLPSVLMVGRDIYIEFLLNLCDFAVEGHLIQLRDSVRNLLKILPTGLKLLSQTLDFCRDAATLEGNQPYTNLKQYVLSKSPSKTVYILELIHSMLMPSVEMRDTESNLFQINFIKCGGINLIFDILTSNDFLSHGDNNLTRSAYMSCLKIIKLLLIAQAYAFIITVSHEIKSNAKAINGERHLAACHVQDAINIIITNVEHRMKSSATIIAKNLTSKLITPQPGMKLVQALQFMSWSSSIGDISLVSNPEAIHTKFQKLTPQSYILETEDVQLTRESLEVMALSMAVSPKVMDSLHTTPLWKPFLIDVILKSKNRLIRVSAQDQLFHSITRCCTQNVEVLLGAVSLLFNALESIVSEHPSTSNEFFRLLARLINHSHHHNIQLEGIRKLLETELKWLEEIREKCLSSQSVCVESQLLEGHLTLIVELIAFIGIEERYFLGSKPDGMKLIPKLLNNFLFPASRIVKQLRKTPDLNYSNQLTTGICGSTDCILAAYKLINALCVGSIENIEALKELLFQLFYSDDDPPLGEWEFFPHVGPRPSKGFVGLKNAGATCYMNAVLQQLYLIPPVRYGVLSLEKPAADLVVQEEETKKPKKAVEKKSPQIIEDDAPPPPSPSDERKDTNCRVLRQLQCIFGHLLEGKVQFHVPRGFWKDFRLEGNKVNLREQHDAFEFFNTLVDSVDEGLKAYGSIPYLSKVLGGSFADQKICKGCPHRYSREEPFTAINVDIRLHHNLFESLDSYVKGDLLEGANAYLCEKCDKKVDTVKRMCIKKLPKVLVIQLKRFDYDWEREMAVKFNDYFEFPREFDLEPYTASGLAVKEGEEIPDTDEKKEKNEEQEEILDTNKSFTTKYRLRGIVVHSGQASGGHYYSFIHVKPPGSQIRKWYKFDDGDVMEARMEDEEELKSQCFGGEYTGEVYDHVLKKSHQRRQKRWWSAYILFYDRIAEDGKNEDSEMLPQVPAPILKQVYHQNLEYLHTRSHFSYAYFQFMKQLLILNYNFAKNQIDSTNSSDAVDKFEKIGMLCMQLVTKFLFHSGFHTKKTLRGSGNEWFESLNPYLHYSGNIRRWFCNEVFLSHKTRFCEYLLECPSAELRNMFAKLVPYLCHITNKDEGFEVRTQNNSGICVTVCLFSDIVLTQLLILLKKEVSDHSRHLQQYFQVFLAYAHKGAFERQQLLKFGVPAQFIAVALDEGPGPALRSPYADLTKLYSVVGILVRCCDVTRIQRSCKEGEEPLVNPYADAELCVKLPNDLHHWVFERTSIQHGLTYVKKIIEDNTPIDELLRFLGFCSWENWDFSIIVIADILMEIATVQPFDMRPYLDLLHHILLMNDSWQMQRFRAMFLGIQDRAEGMMVLIQHGQTHVVHQKRAYLCIKFIVNLCNRCSIGQSMLDNDTHLKQLWNYALQWLQNELDRRQYSTTSYPYAGWSPPAQSNEVSNSYFLERSNSAKMTLTRARELFPVEEVEINTQFEETYISEDGNYDHDTEKVIEEIEEFHDLENNDDNPPEDQLEVNETTVTNVDLD